MVLEAGKSKSMLLASAQHLVRASCGRNGRGSPETKLACQREPSLLREPLVMTQQSMSA